MFSLEGALRAGARPQGEAPLVDAGELVSDSAKNAEQIPLLGAEKSGGLTFDLADGAPIYRADMLARRADALQATKIGREADAVFFNPEDMRELGVGNGDRVVLSPGGAEGAGEWEFPAFADSRLARGAVLAWPEAGGRGMRATDFCATPVLARAEAV